MRKVKIKGILEAKFRNLFNFRAYCRRIYARVSVKESSVITSKTYSTSVNSSLWGLISWHYAYKKKLFSSTANIRQLFSYTRLQAVFIPKMLILKTFSLDTMVSTRGQPKEIFTLGAVRRALFCPFTQACWRDQMWNSECNKHVLLWQMDPLGPFLNVLQ